MPEYTIDLLSDKLNEIEKSIKGTSIGLIGLSYKADVGDLRESPSLEIKELLLKKGAKLEIWDPYFLNMSTCQTLEELLQKSDAIVIATNHKVLKNLKLNDLLDNNVKVVIDGKNCLSQDIHSSNKLIYKGIGR